MNIAIFADLHGKVLLPFKMVDAYQKEYDTKIDLILQCGDVGIFPDTGKLDKATLRHAQRDNQEFGFRDHFTTVNPIIKKLLDKLDIDMICVRGNHEDHDYLDELESITNESRYPIDCYQRVFVCKSGIMQSFLKNEEDLDFIGIGRIGDRKQRDAKRFIQDYEKTNINASLKKHKSLDLLLSHDVSTEMTTPGFGMNELRPLLNTWKPFGHFYGHTGQPYKTEMDANNCTFSVKVKELEFDSSGYLQEGCMFILEKEGGVFEGNPANESFIRQFNKHTWLL